MSAETLALADRVLSNVTEQVSKINEAAASGNAYTLLTALYMAYQRNLGTLIGFVQASEGIAATAAITEQIGHIADSISLAKMSETLTHYVGTFVE